MPAAARQHAVTRLDSLDDPRLIVDVTNQHPIAGNHCIPLVPGQRPNHLADGAFEMAAVIELDTGRLANGAEHASEPTVVQVHVDLQISVGCLGRNDRTVPRGVSLARHAFPGGNVFDPLRIRTGLLREVPLPSAFAPVLLQSHPDLALPLVLLLAQK